MNQNNNSWNHSEEREISISLLLWKIIYSWRLILISTILFAIIFTGLKYVKDIRTAQSKQNDNPTEVLTEQQTTQVETFKLLKKQLEEKQEYNSNSIIMNLNPYQKNVVTLQYYVDTENTPELDVDVQKDRSSNLVNSYIAYIDDGGLLNTVSDLIKWKSDNAYIEELISASDNASNSNGIINQTSTFSVYLVGKDTDTANELADAVEKVVGDYQTILAKHIGVHQLILLNRYTSVIADTALADKQSALEASVLALQSQLATTKNAMSPAQLQIITKENTVESKMETNDSINVAISKEYMLMGAFAGILLCCVWIVLSFVLNGRIKTSQELQKGYGLRVLGSLTIRKKKKRFLSGIDRWLESCHHKNRLTEKEKMDFILTNIVTTFKREQINHMFMAASLPLSEQDYDTVNLLLEGITLSGIQVEFGVDIVNNAEALEKMSNLSRVILIEKIGDTRYDSLEQELLLCQEQEVKVVGVVVLE